MKYIKLFEDLTDKYHDVSNLRDIDISPIEFSDKEGNLLKIGFSKSTPTCYTLIDIDNGGRGTELNIWKVYDEWYYVGYYRRYEKENGSLGLVQVRLYKCDQWDGLMDCLEKEFDIS
jgi:hypothetical protein